MSYKIVTRQICQRLRYGFALELSHWPILPDNVSFQGTYDENRIARRGWNLSHLNRDLRHGGFHPLFIGIWKVAGETSLDTPRGGTCKPQNVTCPELAPLLRGACKGGARGSFERADSTTKMFPTSSCLVRYFFPRRIRQISRHPAFDIRLRR